MDLSAIYSPIQREMARVEERLAQELRADEQPLSQLTAHVAAYKGKRIRPALVLFSGRCLGEISSEHIELAVAMELIHTATLVHDDILDEASLRRNSPTVNIKWGPDVAVMLGDYLLAQAFSLIAAFKSPGATRDLLQTTMTMCRGEIHQLHRRYVLDLDEAEYLQIIERKTAALCSACCRLGALCSESPDGFAEDLARYGANVGIAFQIVDDCLDITGKESKVGKTLYTDLVKGKLTLPIIRLAGLLPEEKRPELKRLLFSKSAREALLELLPALEKHGALEYARARAVEHVEAAKRHLNRLAGSEFKEGLLALADYVIARER
jgi:octaprenyl-diphosphate synthase